jgi:hypothetical protein
MEALLLNLRNTLHVQKAELSMPGASMGITINPVICFQSANAAIGFFDAFLSTYGDGNNSAV